MGDRISLEILDSIFLFKKMGDRISLEILDSIFLFKKNNIIIINENRIY